MKPRAGIRTSVGIAVLLSLTAFLPLVQQPALCREDSPPPDKLYYIVRQGDCLWDISDRFYQTPWVWPKVWRNNAYIANPHWIYPGDLILLAHVPGEGGTQAAPVVEEVRASPASVPPGAITLGIPRSLADTALLREEDFPGSGWVLASRDKRTLMAQGDEVFLQVPASSPRAESGVFQVLRGVRTIVHPQTGARVGTLYQRLGSVEMVGHSDTGIVRARILASRDAIRAGDLLHSGSPPPQTVISKRAVRNVQGSVVAGLRVSDKLVQHDLCFLDKGVLDGVEVGDSFWVLDEGKEVKGFDEAGRVRIPETKVALLVVVHAEKTTSTAVVTESQHPFSVGASVKAWTE